jgi:hypothetical protein
VQTVRVLPQPPPRPRMKSTNLKPFNINIRSTEVFIAFALKSFEVRLTGRMKITIWWQKNFHEMIFSKTKNYLMIDSPNFQRPEDLKFPIRLLNPTFSLPRVSIGTREGSHTMLS